MPRYFLSTLIKLFCLYMWSLFRHTNYCKKDFFSSSIRISGKNIISDDKKISNSNFYKNKKPFNIDDLEVDKKLISEKEPYGKTGSFKYFLGYIDDDNVIGPLCIKLPQMIGYVNHFDSNKTLSFKVNDSRQYVKHFDSNKKLSFKVNDNRLFQKSILKYGENLAF